jgi:RimJ/RimL family protein N-acetyltransferase
MFETDRLIIRPFKESDLDRYLNLANDTRVLPTVTNEYIVPLIPKYKEKLNKIVEEAIFFGIIETKPTEDSELDAEARWVGITTIHTSHPKNRDAIFGIMLDPKHWNKGYGTEVTKWMVDYSFQWLAMHRVSLGVFEGNPSAIDLYKRM